MSKPKRKKASSPDNPPEQPILDPIKDDTEQLTIPDPEIPNADDPEEDVPVVEESLEEVVPEARDLPLVTLQVFCQLSGKKMDQVAGFKLFAKKQKLGPITVPGWHDEFQKFMDRPTK